MSLWSAVVVFVDQLSVCGVMLKYLWCNCLCHLWWHRQLGVFVAQLSVPPLVAQTVGSQKLQQHRQLGFYAGHLFVPLLVAQTVVSQKLQQLSWVAERRRVKDPWQLIAWITTAAAVIGGLNTMDYLFCLTFSVQLLARQTSVSMAFGKGCSIRRTVSMPCGIG